MSKDSYNVAVVGATGAVGAEIIMLLEKRDFPVGDLILLASQRSLGRELTFRGGKIGVQTLTNDSFGGVDIALFSAGSDTSREFAPLAAAAGAVVVDNSSAFRLDPDVPLVIPEINPQALAGFGARNIVANPNCTTAVTVMALKPIHDLSRITRVVATSYQAVSGAGAQAIDELRQQTLDWAHGKPLEHRVFPHQIAFNLIPHIDSFTENGYTKEEMKLHYETRKILGDERINLTATTVRVPVFRSHSISVNLETEGPVSPGEAREALMAFPGMRVVDDPEHGLYPLPIDAAGQSDCLVGRIRKDYTVENGLSLWVVGDQLLKGAALNAVQIAELLVRDYV